MGRWRAGKLTCASHTARMKAILQATLAAILSGIIVGTLLSQKVASGSRSR